MLRKRILAAATAAFLALGMAVGGASPAMAAGNPNNPSSQSDLDNPCDQYGYTKIDSSSGSFSGEWGSFEWDGTGLDLVTEPGWSIDLCLKGGNQDNVFLDGAMTGFYNVTQGSISHIGWMNPIYTPGDAAAGIAFTTPTCEVGETLDESKFISTNATYVVTLDGSNYTVVFTADKGFVFGDGETTQTFTGTLAGPNLELCEEEPGVAAASIALTTPTCEVGETLDESKFVSTNATYVVTFDGLNYTVVFTAAAGFEFAGGETTKTFTGTLAGPDTSLCEEEPGLATASISFLEPDCFFGERLDEEGFEFENATYEITLEGDEFTVEFTADEGFEFAGGETTKTFTGTLDGPLEGEECVLPITDASIAFLDPTCESPEQLDEPNFEFDSELAELESIEVDDEGNFTVVFRTLDEGTRFFQGGDFGTASHSEVTRTVSEGGTVLTFTGTLAGPNTELCPEVVVLPEPVVVDDCFEQSVTLTDTEGVAFAYSVNGGLAMPVEFGDDDTVTIEADPFDTIKVTATAEEGYVLDEGYEPWEYTFTFPEDCLPTGPLTSASVTWTQPDCLGNPGSYTLTNGLGVIWTVDGVEVAGNTTYSVAAGATPTIEASLAGASEEYPLGFGWEDGDQQTLWNLTFAATGTCDIPTLALTGASNALGGLGVAAVLIMMAGTGLVIARRREAARVQG